MAIHCYCNVLSTIRTSSTAYSYGRRFFGCGLYSISGYARCSFFRWIDQKREVVGIEMPNGGDGILSLDGELISAVESSEHSGVIENAICLSKKVREWLAIKKYCTASGVLLLLTNSMKKNIPCTVGSAKISLLLGDLFVHVLKDSLHKAALEFLKEAFTDDFFAPVCTEMRATWQVLRSSLDNFDIVRSALSVMKLSKIRMRGQISETYVAILNSLFQKWGSLLYLNFWDEIFNVLLCFAWDVKAIPYLVNGALACARCRFDYIFYRYKAFQCLKLINTLSEFPELFMITVEEVQQHVDLLRKMFKWLNTTCSESVLAKAECWNILVKIMTALEVSVKPKTPSQNQPSGSKTLCVGNLSWETGRDDIVELFQKFGEVTDVRLATAEDGSFRGFCHVEFSTAEAAQKVFGTIGLSLFEYSVEVVFARDRGAYTPQSRKEPSQKGDQGQSQSVFVKGFDKHLGEFEIRSSLYDHFGLCGLITSVSIPMDNELGSSKGFAFIVFYDQDGASKALELNNSELGGHILIVNETRRPRRESRDGCCSGGRGRGRGYRGGRSGGRFGGRGGRWWLW